MSRLSRLFYTVTFLVVTFVVTTTVSGFYNSPVTNAQSVVRYDNLPDFAEFVVDGRKWNRRNLTYFFQNGTSDISGDGERQAVRDAFALWAGATTLSFTEVSSAASADIVILWGVGEHGDGVPFDGINGVLAHAFFPPPNGSFEGDAHFDDGETWTLGVRPNSMQPMDLVTVAAHEIGHSLGLGHSQVPGALMEAFYNGSHRFLHQDDIDGIRFLYPPGFSSVNAASFFDAPVAPESLVAGFGSGLATTTQSATTIPLPTTLGGRSVRVTDSALISRDAPLLFVSPTQINYQMPAGTAVGTATVTVIASPGGATVAQGSIQVTTVSPGMFAISGSGNPPTASGQWLRYSGGVQVGSGSLDTPIVFGGPGDTVYLILYGTGIRFRSSLSAVSVTAGGSGTIVEYAGAQGSFVGLDQINAIIPQSLAGAGEINVVVTVDGVTANTVKVTAGT